MLLGVDQSLNGTGVCRTTAAGGVQVLLTVALKARAGDQRLLTIRNTLKPLLEGVTFLAMEGYSYGSTNQAFTLGEVGGVIKTLCLEHAIPYLAVPPTVLKMFAVGQGSASKADMIAAAQAAGARPADDNQADAFWLARLAAAYTQGTAHHRRELEAIHSLRTSATRKRPKSARPRRLIKHAI